MPERIKEETEQFIRSVQLPQATDSYSPVAHGDIIDVLEQNLLERNLVPHKKKYVVSKNGLEVYGNWILKQVGQDIELLDPGDQMISINFINSYNKKLKLELCGGVSTCICSNQAMRQSDLQSFERKHTGDINIEFPIFIQNSLENLDEMFIKFQEQFASLREVNLNKKLMSELAGRLFIQHDIITSEQMSLLKREIENPSYPQFIPETAYSFYQHTSFSINRSHPSDILQRYTDVHEFFEQEFLV